MPASCTAATRVRVRVDREEAMNYARVKMFTFRVFGLKGLGLRQSAV